jgi:hypothetical protein
MSGLQLLVSLLNVSYACPNLTSVNFSNLNVQTLGDWAFEGCSSLATVNFRPAMFRPLGRFHQRMYLFDSHSP